MTHYSSRKIAIMMRIMLSDIVIGDGEALPLSLVSALSLTAIGLMLGGWGGPLIRSNFRPKDLLSGLSAN